MMPSKIAAIVHNRSLQTKLVVLCLLVAAISTTLMALFSYSRASELVQNQAYHRAEDTVKQAASYVDESLRNVLNQINSLATNTKSDEGIFWKVALDDGEILSNAERNAAFSQLQSVFTGLRIREPLIASVYLYTPRLDYYELTFPLRDNFKASQTFKEAIQARTTDLWLSPRSDEIFRGDSRVIPLVVPLNLDLGRNFLIVNVREDRFINYLQGLQPSGQGLLYIAAPDGNPSIVPDRLYGDLLRDSAFRGHLAGPRGNFDFSYGGNELLVNYATVEISDWKVISLQPKAELLAGLGDIQRFTGLVGLICLALALGLSSWLAASITRPLATLKHLMRRVEQRDFAVRFPARYTDEVGELGHAFNSMTEEIEQLVHRVEQEQHAKRQAELEALQAQINPHFLYNTLDSIYWKAMMNENEAVSEMAVSLSRLFRLGLNGGREMTTLGREFEHVRHYLDIQKLGYGDSFNYSLKCPPDLTGLEIVKLILQPLAENCLTHGFEDLGSTGRGPGLIEIEARRGPDALLCLSVSDNGRGFDALALKASLDQTESIQSAAQASGHGFALRNVHARLRLHYGDSYRLEMSSQPYERTTIEIWIPARGEISPEREVFGTDSENNPPAEQKQPINIGE